MRYLVLTYGHKLVLLKIRKKEQYTNKFTQEIIIKPEANAEMRNNNRMNDNAKQGSGLNRDARP